MKRLVLFFLIIVAGTLAFSTARLIITLKDGTVIEYNMEDIVRKNPSVFLVSSDLGDIESLSAAEGYRELRAVKEGHVYAINADTSSRPAPRIVEALSDISAAVHQAAAR